MNRSASALRETGTGQVEAATPRDGCVASGSGRRGTAPPRSEERPVDISRTVREGVTVVAPHGDLDLRTAPYLRRAILETLADQPVGLVCDLELVKAAEPSVLTSFLAVIRQARDWPGVRVAFCGANEQVRAQFRRLGLDQLIALRGSVAEAAADVAGPPVVQDRLRVPAEAAAVAHVREFVRARVLDQPSRLAADAVLVASELVTNAFEHARTPATVYLGLRPETIRVAVADSSPVRPRRRRVTADDDRGRGLNLVDALSQRWGVLATSGGGKLVWSLLADTHRRPLIRRTRVPAARPGRPPQQSAAAPRPSV
jgi:anti-anti-sigma factor